MRCSSARQQLLRTRGLFVAVVHAPCPPAQGTFEWLIPLPDDLDFGDTIWYIDGSLIDDTRRLGRRLGFGIAVLSSGGQLLAIGRGTPPHWVHDAAGADLWACRVALHESPGPPRTVSDCKGIRDCLALPRHRLLGVQARLGRTWAMIMQTMDSDLVGARALMTWMPSHTSAACMLTSPPMTSAGAPVTWLDWRANRLVVLLAKSIAAQHRLPTSIFQWLRGAEQFQRHQAAVLGLVTHAATHFEVQGVEADGNNCRRTIRDSWGQRPLKPRTWHRFAPKQDVQQLPAPSASSPGTSSTAPW